MIDISSNDLEVKGGPQSFSNKLNKLSSALAPPFAADWHH